MVYSLAMDMTQMAMEEGPGLADEIHSVKADCYSWIQWPSVSLCRARFERSAENPKFLVW